MKTRARIMAWGNRGRRDDGVARVLADRLAGCFADDPTVLIEQYHQLAPELAADLHRCGVVVFMDAHLRADAPDVIFEMVRPATTPALDTHHCTPGALSRLCAALNGCVPECYLLAIRAYDTDFGDNLSLGTERAMIEAEQVLLDFLDARLRPPIEQRVVRHA